MNTNKLTPLDIAAYFGHKRVAEYLAEQSGRPLPVIRKSSDKKIEIYKSPGGLFIHNLFE
jgi:ankyrin repeat protein